MPRVLDESISLLFASSLLTVIAGCEPSVPFGQYDDVVKLVIENSRTSDRETKITVWQLRQGSEELEMATMRNVQGYRTFHDVPDDQYPHVIWKQADAGGEFGIAELHLRDVDVFGTLGARVTVERPTLSRSVLDGDIIVEYGLGNK